MLESGPNTTPARPSQVEVLREALSLGAPDLLAQVEERLGLLVNCLNASGYRILRGRPQLTTVPVRPSQVEVLREVLSHGASDLLDDLKERMGLLVNCLNASGYRIARPPASAPDKESK